MIRDPAQSASITALGATPIVQSLETATFVDLSSTVRRINPDALVFCAGSGKQSFTDPTITTKIDRNGAIKCFDAMAESGITKRLIMLSVVDSRDRKLPAPEWYDETDKDASDSLWAQLEGYMVAKFEADRDLVVNNARRGLQYTIVRPNWYSQDTVGSGRISAGKIHVPVDARVSREDTAAVLAGCVEDDRTVGLIFDVTGGDVPVKDALEGVVRDRVNVFKELYSQ